MANKTLTLAQVCFLMGAVVACVGDDPSSGTTPADDGGAGSSSGNASSSSGAASSSGGSSSSGSSGETDSGVDANPLAPDAAPPAGCPLGCLPPAAMGWTGPSAVWDDVTANKPAACPPLYTLQEVQTHRDMTAAAATCSCTGTVSGAKCSTTARVYTTTSSSCTLKAGFNAVTVDSTGCTAAVGATATDVFVLTPTFTQGACKFPAATVTKPAVVYGKETVSCGLPAAGACENRADCVATPIPDAPFTRLCIHKDGDELCPSADYAVRFVTYKNVDDQRGCNTDCAGNATGGACGTKWGFSASTKACALLVNPPTDYTVGTSCAPAPDATSVVNGIGFAPTGMACTTTKQATPNGAAKSIDPVTFCCNK